MEYGHVVTTPRPGDQSGVDAARTRHKLTLTDDPPGQAGYPPAETQAWDWNAAANAVTARPDGVATPAGHDAAAISRERLRIAAESSLLCLWDLDVGTGLVHRWGDYTRLLGVDVATVSDPRAYQRYVHPSDVAQQKAALQHSLTTGKSHHREYRVLRGDGEVRWVLQHGEAIVGASGAVQRVVGVLLDVTGQRHAQPRLAEGLEAALEGLPAIDHCRADGRALHDVTESRVKEAETLAVSADRAHRSEQARRPAEMTSALDRLNAVQRREHAFADIAATMASAGSLEQTLDAVARAIVEATSTVACAIILFEGEPPIARVAGACGLPGGYRREYAAAWRSGRPLPSVRAFETRRRVVVPDVSDDPSLDGLVDPAWQALVCLPLIVRGSPLGTLQALYPSGRKPNDVDVTFLQAVADQAAVAVDTARTRAEASEAAAIREQHRLAWGLHDSVIQLLFSTSLLARASHRKLERAGGTGSGGLPEMLAEVENLSAAALAEMRALLFTLRPQPVDGTGSVRLHRTPARSRGGDDD